MTHQPPFVSRLTPSDIDENLTDLCRVLVDSVADGAAISFMMPLDQETAARFWADDVKPAVEKGERHLFGAFAKGRLIGTVQLLLSMPPNQPHRAEISKMIVHPMARRQGLGKALMSEALAAAQDEGKTLVTLDTRTGDVSESLYKSVGFEPAGIIPDFAFDPDGQSRHATTYMYRYL
ncbi:GNAT family N-acetyltransferase [Ruegeria sp. R14_0]|uniref:GNAT family N-acetyltransferase n=1 Tax=Ruegeria sp. R14_0 TaxID=2821100 RepID=UPI001ADD1FAE|nr:GNAT family N-acetyltransferase [Ruegeria sp. R14_0]MBO9445942.1 GNAT family N-acetyltransferase [Ruegeria sp. R14_0]